MDLCGTGKVLAKDLKGTGEVIAMKERQKERERERAQVRDRTFLKLASVHPLI